METVLILDFGAQYSQLIARRVREQNVYCEVKPCSISPAEIEKIAPIGIILSGGPNSVYESDYQADPALITPLVKEYADKYAKEKNIKVRTCN